MMDRVVAQPMPTEVPEKKAACGDDGDCAKLKAAVTDLSAERQAHAIDFSRRTGWSPRGCYRLILGTLALRIIASSLVAMVALEYGRYYVMNDISLVATMEAATGSPKALVKAFLFPFWGVMADRLSRRRIMVISTVANCAAVWLLAVIPSIEVYIVFKVLTLVGDVGWSIRSAILRDIFSNSEWERIDGGITGIKSRMAVVGSLAMAVGVALGMSTLKIGELVGLENEYSVRKEECRDQVHCLPRGKFSWDGGWAVDGSLRLVMLMGCFAYSMEVLVTIVFLPETLRPECQRESSMWGYVKQHWREFGSPWNNLRVFATTQLRELVGIRMIWYAIGTGMSSGFLSWYRRMDLDTFTMYTMGVPTGVVGFLVLLFVTRLVDRFGDLRGIWIPSNVLLLLYAGCIVLTPASHWQISYVVFPLLGGPATALTGFSPELLAKLIPPDVQGTYQTGKSFLHDITHAALVWPWLGLLVISEDLAYPFDCLPIMVLMTLGVLALVLTCRQLASDPREAIQQGRGLDAFWGTAYARGKWYRRHGGRPPDACGKASSGPISGLRDHAIIAEGTSKAGLIFPLGGDHSAYLEAYLQFLGRMPNAKSLSVLFHFVDGEDLFQDPGDSVPPPPVSLEAPPEVEASEVKAAQPSGPTGTTSRKAGSSLTCLEGTQLSL